MLYMIVVLPTLNVSFRFLVPPSHRFTHDRHGVRLSHRSKVLWEQEIGLYEVHVLPVKS